MKAKSPARRQALGLLLPWNDGPAPARPPPPPSFAAYAPGEDSLSAPGGHPEQLRIEGIVVGSVCRNPEFDKGEWASSRAVAGDRVFFKKYDTL